VSENNESADGLLAMLKRVVLKNQDQIIPVQRLEGADIESEPQQVEAEPPPEPEPPAPEISAINPITETRKTRSSAEIQHIILTALLAIPDASKDGMSVTVYGYNPWNAMVTFAPGSATTATAKAIQGLLGRIVDQLRHQIEIEIPKD
jgi:hypothetical protein